MLGFCFCNPARVARRRSIIRSRYQEHFEPSVDLRPNKFTWLGSTKPLDAFKYFFRETPEGIILAHCYQYEEGRSTWVIETDEATWKNFGFDTKDEPAMLQTIERVFAEELGGHRLIANRSLWRNFPTITNRTSSRPTNFSSLAFISPHHIARAHARRAFH